MRNGRELRDGGQEGELEDRYGGGGGGGDCFFSHTSPDLEINVLAWLSDAGNDKLIDG